MRIDTARIGALEAKSLDAPEEVRSYGELGRVDIVTVGGVAVGRGVVEPGWRWSEHVAATAGTALCTRVHLGYVIAGRMGVAMSGGDEGEAVPGDAFAVPAGHDAWTLGSERCVFLDFTGMGS